MMSFRLRYVNVWLTEVLTLPHAYQNYIQDGGWWRCFAQESFCLLELPSYDSLLIRKSKICNFDFYWQSLLKKQNIRPLQIRHFLLLDPFMNKKSKITIALQIGLLFCSSSELCALAWHNIESHKFLKGEGVFADVSAFQWIGKNNEINKAEQNPLNGKSIFLQNMR